MLCPPGAEGHACMDKCAVGLKCPQFPGAICRVNNCTSNCRIEFYIAKSWSPEEYCFPDVWIPPPSNSLLHVTKKPSCWLYFVSTRNVIFKEHSFEKLNTTPCVLGGAVAMACLWDMPHWDNKTACWYF